MAVANEDEARRYVRTYLRRRESAPKRIGIGYTVRQVINHGGDDDAIIANAIAQFTKSF